MKFMQIVQYIVNVCSPYTMQLCPMTDLSHFLSRQYVTLKQNVSYTGNDMYIVGCRIGSVVYLVLVGWVEWVQWVRVNEWDRWVEWAGGRWVRAPVSHVGCECPSARTAGERCKTIISSDTKCRYVVAHVYLSVRSTVLRPHVLSMEQFWVLRPLDPQLLL